MVASRSVYLFDACTWKPAKKELVHKGLKLVLAKFPKALLQ
jgi:hypothetical protein